MDNVIGGFITLFLGGIGFFLIGILFLMIAEDYLDSKKRRNKRNAKSCNCRY